MSKIKNLIKQFLESSNDIISGLDSKVIENFAEQLKKAKRVYTVGVGSLSLLAKGFTTKLTYLGYETYFIGETLMPSPSKNDLLIAISESGEADYTVKAARIAKNLGATVVAITSCPQSTLGKLADLNIEIKWKEKIPKEELKEREGELLTPNSSLFEIVTLMILNAVMSELVNKT
ncbi:MAG: SIS domain-containing protein [Candidatus Baldrarchaeia archaeon]|nr:SIS domain-containing protein [Candidatus Baldrarchaeota archaeon]